MLSFRPIAGTFFSFIEVWKCSSHFSITDLLCIYDYMLKKPVNRWHSWHLYFFNGFLLAFVLSNVDVSNDT